MFFKKAFLFLTLTFSLSFADDSITIGIAPQSSPRIIIETHNDLKVFLENYFKANCFNTLFTSALLTIVVPVRFLFCLVSFLVKIWLLYACFLLIFPDPVSLNLFLAPDFVFNFGIFFYLLIYICYQIFISL